MHGDFTARLGQILSPQSGQEQLELTRNMLFLLETRTLTEGPITMIGDMYSNTIQNSI